MTITTHWVDTSWSGPGTLRDPVILATLCQVSIALHEPRLIYPRSLGVRSRSVTALAFAIDEDAGPIGARGFARRAGQWHGSFSYTHARFRRQGVSGLLLRHALADLPLVALEGPFTPAGYQASKALGLRHGLQPAGEAFVHGPLVTPVLPDWSLGDPVSLLTLLQQSAAHKAARDRLEPWTDLPQLELSPIMTSPAWMAAAREVPPLLLNPPGTAFGPRIAFDRAAAVVNSLPGAQALHETRPRLRLIPGGPDSEAAR